MGHFSDDFFFQSYLKDLQKYPRLKPEQVVSLSRRFHHYRDLDAFNQLVCSNLLLVVYEVTKTFGHLACQEGFISLSALDLIQEGNIGLFKAVKKFDPEFGTLFSTYALHWIHRYIQKSLNRFSHGPISVPDYIQEEYYRLQAAYSQNPEALDDILETMDESYQSRFALLQRNCFVSTSTSVSRDRDDAVTLGDILQDGEHPLTLEQQIHFRTVVDYVCSILTVKEQSLLRLRYGLALSHNGDPAPYSDALTLQQIGELSGITRQAVSKQEIRVFKKLREHWL